MSTSADAAPDNVLFEWYGRYVGEPDAEADVYLGFALFFGGIALGAVGVLVFLLSAAVSGPADPAFGLRQVAVVASAVGLPTFLIGIVVLLPGDRRMTYAAAAGIVVCLVAVALFVAVYPMHWNVEQTPDYSAQGIAVYAVGLVAVVGATGAALVGHQVQRVGGGAAPTGEADDETDAEPTVSDERVRRDVDEATGDADLSWGGVERRETRRLELNTDTPDDVQTNVDQVGAETATTAGDDVDEAVSGLRQLQGREEAVDSGSDVDEQTAALTELRRQQEAEELASASGTDDDTLLGRVKRLLSR